MAGNSARVKKLTARVDELESRIAILESRQPELTPIEAPVSEPAIAGASSAQKRAPKLAIKSGPTSGA